MKKIIRWLAFHVFAITSVQAQWVHSISGLSNTGVLSVISHGNKVFAGTNISIDQSTNNGNNWTQVIPCGVVLSFASNGNNLFAAAGGVGILRSTDNGVTWDTANAGLTTTDINSVLINGSNIFAGTMGDGIFISTNNGTTWSLVNNGLTNLDVRSLATDGANIFAGTLGSGAFLSANNGANWLPINTGMPNTSWVRAFAFNGANLFAATDNGIYRSINNGSSWTAVNSGLTTFNIFSLLVSGTTILAATGDSGVFLSVNNGNNWMDFSQGLPPIPGIGFSLAANTTTVFVTMYSDGIYTRPLSQVITSTPEISEQDNITIFPNPVTDKININIPGSEQSFVEIYDAIGRPVYSQKIIGENTLIDFQNKPTGIYIAEVICSERKVFEKIIKY